MVTKRFGLILIALQLSILLVPFGAMSLAAGTVLSIVDNQGSLQPWEVEYESRLLSAGYSVVRLGYDDGTLESALNSGIDLSPYNLVYWNDFAGGGVTDPLADTFIDALVAQQSPFMTANPKFAIKWGLAASYGDSGDPTYFDGTQWLDDQTSVTLHYTHPMFDGLAPYSPPQSLEVYGSGGSPPWIGVFGTVSPDAQILATAWDTIHGADRPAIVEFPIGAFQPYDSVHGVPTAPFIHLGMGDEVSDAGANSSWPANDSEYFWSVFIGAADYLTVPIPGAAWLFSSGLICLVGIRKKFKK